MQHPLIQHYKKQLLSNPLKKILFAEMADERIKQAAQRLAAEKLVKPTFVAEKAECYPDCTEIEVIVPQQHQHFKTCVQNLYQQGKGRGITLQEAEQLAQRPLIYSYLLVQAGLMDGCVNGAVHSTAEVVRYAFKIIGSAHKTVSSFFLMLATNQQAYLFSDCAIVINPDPQTLAEIAGSTIESAQFFLQQKPKVAMLSFSTNGSASHQEVDKVRQATQLVRQVYPDVCIEGEIQLDAAIVPSVSQQKHPNSAIGGQANVLIFPDLNAANIGYKIAQNFGKATAIGPILQGLNKPANDLSRGCTTEEVYLTTIMTALQAHAQTHS